MALPTLLPVSKTSKSILPETGSHGNVDRLLPYKIYSDSRKLVLHAVLSLL